MLEKLRTHVKALDGEIEHMELCDHACTTEYVLLKKERKLIVKTIKKLERIHNQYDKHQN